MTKRRTCLRWLATVPIVHGLGACATDVPAIRWYSLIPTDEPGRYTDRGAMETGSSSSGTGYTARAIVERRVTSNWFVGLGVDIQEAKDYTPSHALLYVRYSAAGWQGDMDLPPQPLIPYADW